MPLQGTPTLHMSSQQRTPPSPAGGGRWWVGGGRCCRPLAKRSEAWRTRHSTGRWPGSAHPLRVWLSSGSKVGLKGAETVCEPSQTATLQEQPGWTEPRCGQQEGRKQRADRGTQGQAGQAGKGAAINLKRNRGVCHNRPPHPRKNRVTREMRDKATRYLRHCGEQGWRMEPS